MVLAIGLVLPRASYGQERSFSLNVKRVQIDQLIRRVSRETGRGILFDEEVRGMISVVAKRLVTESEAWSILESSLSMLGFSLLPSTADNWKIVKVAEAVGESPFVLEVGTTSASFVTALIPLENANLQDVLNVLRPISGARVTLVPLESAHSLVASGPEREIARLTVIADELDRIDRLELRHRVLRYRGVVEVEPLVEAWIESGGISDRLLQVWSDERTNSILFRGAEREVRTLSRLLDRIDQPVEAEGRIRILRVLNRDAEEVAELIRELGRPTGSSNATATVGLQLAGTDFDIVVDKASRSLVVRADARTHALVREALEIFDELPQLIAVDITISELRTPRSYELGIGFSVPFSTGNDVGSLSGLILSTPSPGGLLKGPTDQTVAFGRVERDVGVPFTIDDGTGVQIPILESIVIDGGEFTARVEVLSRPSLIITAGDHHEIFVGSNIPVPVTESSGIDDSGSGTIALLSRTTRFERTDIGIRLGIDAKAGREGKIQLVLDLDISSIVPSIAGDVTLVGPTFVQQKLRATARLDDGETAIIAVNRQKTEGRIKSGVPWFSQIPILGWFFSAVGEQDQDVRLVIAARASRISSPAELVADSIRRRLAFQRRNARDGALPTPIGPPFGVRVTTREREDDAEAIAQGLSLRGYQAVIHPWSLDGEDFFDVYIVALDSMAEAAEVASVLSQDGWQADLVVFPRRS